MPNRHERLATRAMARKRPIKREVAVHEAGHAVGRFLTAERLGYTIDEAISCIEVNAVSVATGEVSFDGRMRMSQQATTFGPKFSRELAAFIKSSPGYEGPFRASVDDLVELIDKARNMGLDVDGWFRAKAFSTILGPMAEAKLLGKPFKMVWSDYEAEGDFKDTVIEGIICSMTAEQIGAAIDEVTIFAEQEVERPEVWRAILALADKLKPGRMSGKEAAAIIKHALKT